MQYFTIEGIASTDSIDSFSESVSQYGIDLSQVHQNQVKINIEHGEDFPLLEMSVIGIVTEAEIRDEGLWIRGKVYCDHIYSDAVYKELTKPNGILQLSVELDNCKYGHDDDSNRVISSVLAGIAITKNPANSETYVELAKSLKAMDRAHLIDDFIWLKNSLNQISSRLNRKKKIKVTVIKIK